VRLHGVIIPTLKTSVGEMRLCSIADQRAFRLTQVPILEFLEEYRVKNRGHHSETFAEKVLTLLEERFPWLAKESDEQVSGADTVDELSELHRNLIKRRTLNRRLKRDADQ
jgi:hypothetical protein